MHSVSAPPRPLLPVKCLLVDDLQDNLLALSALLKRDNVEIFTATSGEQALELALIHEFALAFLDVQMPDMDGFELAELLRGSERTRDIPLIFVTAGNRDQHRLFKGYETGAVDFLHKPIDPYILNSKAEIFFRLHRQKLQLAEELKRRTEMLRLNEMFMAVLGHDLRNPLSSIVNSAHLIQLASTEPKVKSAAAIMLASGNRMGRMIGDLLDLVRARLGGGIPLKPVATDLYVVLSRVVEELRANYPDRIIDVTRNGDCAGEWDPDRLAQVASNLLGNALQHGTPGRSVTVTLDGTLDAAIRLTIGNDGAIPADLLPLIFQPFRGAENPNHANGGLGLGLFIVQEIVTAHEGTVKAEVISVKETHNTVFTVVLPRVTNYQRLQS
ncbi:MAG: hybrid sensor histidine kinase/response regulator [Betaproteobacteria bacterium]